MTIAGYLISIAGISIATVMIEVILPEGNMAAFIRRIAALIVVFVIIAPIPGLIKKQSIGFVFESAGRNDANIINYDLLAIVYKQRAKELEYIITDALEKEGIVCDVYASIDTTKAEFELNFVSIRVTQGSGNIESIKRAVKKYVKIDDSKIFIT